MLMATPLFAQAAIQEPGAFAFYHPNADVLNGGGPTPAASGALASVQFGASDAYAAMGGNANGSSCAQRYRSYDPASGTCSAMMVTGIRASDAARENERAVDRTASFEICHLQSGACRIDLMRSRKLRVCV